MFPTRIESQVANRRGTSNSSPGTAHSRYDTRHYDIDTVESHVSDRYHHTKSELLQLVTYVIMTFEDAYATQVIQHRQA